MTAEATNLHSRGPLSGYLVVDLTRVLAGPYCTMMLAELGARVIKVEAPGGGDDARGYGPFMNGKSAYFMSLNRGKESIALDLKQPADRGLFEAMVARADVLVENFRPGAMEKLGYGWDVLHARHPRLVYAASSGFGHTGPDSRRAAYDVVVQGMGGIMSLTGEEGGNPVRVGTSVGDITAGLFTAIGVTSALAHRERTGEGMKIDVAMLDCQVAILENAIARYFSAGEVPGPIGTRHPSITPFEAYPTVDGHVIVAAGNNALFARLGDALGLPALKDDPRFADNDLRTRNVAALRDVIGPVLVRRSTAEWLAVLDRAGVPCGPINDIAQALGNPQIAARNMVVTSEDPAAGSVKMAGNPIKLSAFGDPPTRPAAPDLDADRARLVAEFGGV